LLAPSDDHQCAWRDEADKLRSELDQMRAKLDALTRKVFAKSSEKMPPIDRELRRGEKADPEKTREKRRRAAEFRTTRALSEDVETKVPDEKRTCPHCQSSANVRTIGLGKECSVWHWVPGFFRRMRYVRETVSCKCGSYVFTAPCPDKGTTSEKTRYAPSFIAHLIVSKCDDSLPLYRLEQQYQRLGIPMARSTMSDLFHRAAEQLAPLAEALLAEIRAAAIVHADETPIRMQTSKTRAYIWTFLAANLVAYKFSASRSGKTPCDVLGASQGYLVVDAYTGYNAVTCAGGRVRVGCLAHVRRKFFEARTTAPEADVALEIITGIYRVERAAKDQQIIGTNEHLTMRRGASRPLTEQLHSWLLEQKPMHPPKSPIGTAIGYALDNWEPITRFLDDASLPLDNNAAEAALRTVALIRKNSLFVHDEEKGANLAVLLSLIASCEQNDINPVAYITDVLTRIAKHPASRIAELLPHRWKPSPA
jgi:transposase